MDALAAARAKHGEDWCADPRRCEAMLKDLLSGHPREIKLLMDAVKAGVVRDLAGNQTGLPVDVRLRHWVRRLHDDMGLREDLASRAVGLWAIALGVTDTMPSGSEVEHAPPGRRVEAEPVSGGVATPGGDQPTSPVLTATSPRPPSPPRHRPFPPAMLFGALLFAGLVAAGLGAWSVSSATLKRRSDGGAVNGADGPSSESVVPTDRDGNPPPDQQVASTLPPSPVYGIHRRHRLLAAPTAAPRAVSISPDGRVAAVEEHEHVDPSRQRKSGKARISLWDVDANRRLRTLDGHDNTLNFLTFSSDGALLASGGKLADKSLRVWDVATGERRCAGPELAWSPTYARIFDSGAQTRVVHVDANAGIRELRLKGCLTSDELGLEGSTPFACDISADGRRLLLGCFDGLRMVDLEARELQWHVSLGREEEGRFTAAASAVALSADGGTVMAAVDERWLSPDAGIDPDKSWETTRVGLALFSTATGKKLRNFPWREDEYPGHKVRITGLHLLDSHFAISCDEAGRLIVWHVPTGEPVLERKVEEAPRKMAVSADGSRMLLSGDESVTVWDLER